MRALLRACLPQQARLNLRLMERRLQDYRSGLDARLVRAEGQRESWPARLTLRQAIHDGPLAQGKRHNLRLAAGILNDRVIPQGKVLSVGALLGNPCRQRGYRQGRMLSGSEVTVEYGGGLCQLSGLLHFIALHAGLEVLERHPHSADIYTEETRFCPLGSDATIVYGYKDLRLGNPHPFPLAFRIEVEDDALTGHLCGPVAVTLNQVDFQREDDADGTRVVRTFINGRVIRVNQYAVPPLGHGVD